ncbi:MAG: hypothetical protein O4965_10135 [Trichodesmium sp. St19_bin1]|nr:hypothetical protein [Trichodesmium sp. St19_bin1]
MSNYLDFEIFDSIDPDVHLTIDNENQTILLDYDRFDTLKFFTLVSKVSKYCRNCANNIYNYPIRKITTKFRGNTMTFDIHIKSKDIHDYYLVFDEVFSSKGSSSVWEVLSGYPVIASPNSLSASNISKLTRRSEDNNKLPIGEYFSQSSLKTLYNCLDKDEKVEDCEIKGYLTCEIMDVTFPKQEMKRYELGIDARYVIISDKPCVLCNYKLK